MTRVAFISKVYDKYRLRPYSESIYTIKFYIVRDDKKFEMLVDTIEKAKNLEELAKEFKVIEEESEVDAISFIWGKVEEV